MIKQCSIDINGQQLNVETGRIAKQASGSVVVTFGETVLLVTVVSTGQVREGVDFLPLTVEYKEMSYAEPGYLMWHDSCPDDLLKFHEIYRQYL